jgi:hypothetical protein
MSWICLCLIRATSEWYFLRGREDNAVPVGRWPECLAEVWRLPSTGVSLFAQRLYQWRTCRSVVSRAKWSAIRSFAVGVRSLLAGTGTRSMLSPWARCSVSGDYRQKATKQVSRCPLVSQGTALTSFFTRTELRKRNSWLSPADGWKFIVPCHFLWVGGMKFSFQ